MRSVLGKYFILAMQAMVLAHELDEFNLSFLKVEGNTLYYHLDDFADHAGNFLTQYYNARGYAKYHGLCFNYTNSAFEQHDHFLNYYPRYVCPDHVSFSSQELFKLASTVIFKECGQFFVFPHYCKGFWLYMREEMQSETKSVIEQYEKAKNIAPLTFRTPDTSVIHIRCLDHDTIFAHYDFGPTAFSLYNDMKHTADILIVSGAGTASSPNYNKTLCGQLEAPRINYLQKLYPHANITEASKSTFEDFRLLVKAPNLYRDSSTFGLVASMANIGGNIYSSPMFITKLTFDSPNVSWSNAGVLLPSVAEKDLDFGCHQYCREEAKNGNKERCFCNDESEGPKAVTHEEVLKIIHWLETH